MWGKAKNVSNISWDTLIGPKIEVVGDIRATGNMHIDGRVRGNIVAGEDSDVVVRVSDHGVVEGEIHAPNIIINGKVTGNVFCSKHVEMASKAVVNGDVYYQIIEMVKGAQINGNLIHQDSQVKSGKPYGKEASEADRFYSGNEYKMPDSAPSSSH